MTTPNPCDKPERPYTAGADPDPGQTFWMVYVAGRQTPAVQHLSCSDAQQEAMRLARKEPGRPVYILRAMQWAVCPSGVVFEDCRP